MAEEKEHKYRNPYPTVDIIIQMSEGKVVLIKRGNPPYGWALPGGFVDWGESLEHAAVREALEETGLAVSLVRQFHTYSDPARDPRHHTISTVFIATAEGLPRAGDDAADIRLIDFGTVPEDMAFDHAQILRDFYAGRLT